MEGGRTGRGGCSRRCSLATVPATCVIGRWTSKADLVKSPRCRSSTSTRRVARPRQTWLAATSAPRRSTLARRHRSSLARSGVPTRATASTTLGRSGRRNMRRCRRSSSTIRRRRTRKTRSPRSAPSTTTTPSSKAGATSATTIWSIALAASTKAGSVARTSSAATPSSTRSAAPASARSATLRTRTPRPPRRQALRRLSPSSGATSIRMDARTSCRRRTCRTSARTAT